MKRVEKALAVMWPYLLIGMLILVACTSCRVSRIVTDPVTGEQRLEVTGEDILPGGGVVEDVTGIPLEDIAGAVGDAVSNTDVSQVAQDVNEGDWLAVILALVGLGSATAYGIKKRKKIRELIAGKKTEEPRAS